MLGVFLLPTLTCLGRECPDLLSPCDGMHVCTDKTWVCTLTRKSFFGNGVGTDVYSKGKIHSTGNILLRGGLNPRHCITQDSDHNTQAIILLALFLLIGCIKYVQ